MRHPQLYRDRQKTPSALYASLRSGGQRECPDRKSPQLFGRSFYQERLNRSRFAFPNPFEIMEPTASKGDIEHLIEQHEHPCIGAIPRTKTINHIEYKKEPQDHQKFPGRMLKQSF